MANQTSLFRCQDWFERTLLFVVTNDVVPSTLDDVELKTHINLAFNLEASHDEMARLKGSSDDEIRASIAYQEARVALVFVVRFGEASGLCLRAGDDLWDWDMRLRQFRRGNVPVPRAWFVDRGLDSWLDAINSEEHIALLQSAAQTRDEISIVSDAEKEGLKAKRVMSAKRGEPIVTTGAQGIIVPGDVNSIDDWADMFTGWGPHVDHGRRPQANTVVPSAASCIDHETSTLISIPSHDDADVKALLKDIDTWERASAIIHDDNDGDEERPPRAMFLEELEAVNERIRQIMMAKPEGWEGRNTGTGRRT